MRAICNNAIHDRSCYTGKRCGHPDARKANAEYKRNKTANYRAATASTNAALSAAGATFFDPKLTHGLPSTYEWYGCRCPECSEAYSQREKEYRLIKLFS
jgi:hypothetical protein